MNPKHKGVALLWLLNLAGNAALIAAVYFWLLLPDAHGWQVGGSALLALLVIFFELWLRTGSFAYFRMGEFRDNEAIWHAFRRSLQHLVALAIWAVPFAAVEWYLYSLRVYAPQFGVWFWRKLPAALRLGTPRQMYHAADWLLLFLIWILLPMLWLPVASTVAVVGLKPGHMLRSLRLAKRQMYWLWYGVVLAVGVYVPYKLAWWIPDLSDLRKQAWSMGARFALAYVLLISGWVALLLVIGTRVEKEDPDSIATAATSSTERR
jgi:hypothetical protein